MIGPRTCLPMVLLLTCSGMLPTVASLTAPAPVRADEADPPTASRAAQEGILVMRTGAIISGKILRSGRVYDVQTTNGKMAVPETLVKLHAENLTDAYEKLHDGALSQQSANAHVLLAQWCLTNRLHNEARVELNAALKLEPDREDAKRLLRNAEEALRSDEAPAANVVVHEDPVRAARQAAAATDEAVSLGGLSREQALQFARRIQPLLVNNCTAAGCHGLNSKTGFRLYKVTPGRDANRHAAERNLAEVLEWIDVKKPRSSRLLTAPRGNHGRRGRPIFAGSRGEGQLEELQKWVAAIAAEETVRGKPDDNEGRRMKSVRHVSAADDEHNLPAGRSGAGSRDVVPAAKPFPTSVRDASASSKPLPAGRGDPFDPAVFNRGADRGSRR
ncbi:MAG: hypothetical protein ACM3U2_17625 [Deltaproteobacteria bacterium]